MSIKITLITGASSGIGRELAIVFASKGNNLLLVSRSEDELKKLAEELSQKYNIQAKYLAKDLSLASSPKEVYEYCLTSNLEVNNLINNAGFGDFGLFNEVKLSRQIEMINLNISALVALTHLFIPNMIANREGRILNVASTAAFQPGPLMSVYFATKAFVLSFSEAITNELKPYNISVTALCPGPTASNFKAAANLENSRMMKARKLPTSAEVAEFGYQALMAGKMVAIHGRRNRLLASLIRFIPRKLILKSVRKLQENF